MPVSRTCTFCGNDIEPGTGKMYVRRDGTTHFFCSGKCQKNQLHLGRQGRKVRWTRRYVRAVPQRAPGPSVAAEPALEAEPKVVEPAIGEAAPAEVRKAALEEDRETVLQAFGELPGIGPATAEALWEAGFTSLENLGTASVADLTEVKGIGPATAKDILAHLVEGGR